MAKKRKPKRSDYERTIDLTAALREGEREGERKTAAMIRRWFPPRLHGYWDDPEWERKNRRPISLGALMP